MNKNDKIINISRLIQKYDIPVVEKYRTGYKRAGISSTAKGIMYLFKRCFLDYEEYRNCSFFGSKIYHRLAPCGGEQI